MFKEICLWPFYRNRNIEIFSQHKPIISGILICRFHNTPSHKWIFRKRTFFILLRFYQHIRTNMRQKPFFYKKATIGKYCKWIFARYCASSVWNFSWKRRRRQRRRNSFLIATHTHTNITVIYLSKNFIFVNVLLGTLY